MNISSFFEKKGDRRRLLLRTFVIFLLMELFCRFCMDVLMPADVKSMQSLVRVVQIEGFTNIRTKWFYMRLVQKLRHFGKLWVTCSSSG